MPEPAALGAALMLGAALGAAFVAGLAWTVRRGVRTGAGAGWYLGSFLARLALAAVALAAVAGDLGQLLAAGIGFLAARPIAVRAWLAGEGTHARHP